jgi:hypothetical protein
MLGTMEINEKTIELLKSLQAKLDLDDERMAEKFGVKERTYISWKYRERNPSKSALVLLAMLCKQHKVS